MSKSILNSKLNLISNSFILIFILIHIISFSSSFKISNNIDFTGNIQFSFTSNPNQWREFGSIFINNKQMLSIKNSLNKENSIEIVKECEIKEEIIFKINISSSGIDYISSVDACDFKNTNFNSIFQFSFLDENVNPNNISAISVFSDQYYSLFKQNSYDSVVYNDIKEGEFPEKSVKFKSKVEFLSHSKVQSINFSNEKDNIFDKASQKQGTGTGSGTTEEEPSFFKKYWWVILILIVMVNAKMPSEDQSQNQDGNENSTGQKKKRE